MMRLHADFQEWIVSNLHGLNLLIAKRFFRLGFTDQKKSTPTNVYREQQRNGKKFCVFLIKNLALRIIIVFIA